jgi:hypothetical protein
MAITSKELNTEWDNASNGKKRRPGQKIEEEKRQQEESRMEKTPTKSKCRKGGNVDWKKR